MDKILKKEGPPEPYVHKEYPKYMKVKGHGEILVHSEEDEALVKSGKDVSHLKIGAPPPPKAKEPPKKYEHQEYPKWINTKSGKELAKDEDHEEELMKKPSKHVVVESKDEEKSEEIEGDGKGEDSSSEASEGEEPEEEASDSGSKSNKKNKKNKKNKNR